VVITSKAEFQKLSAAGVLGNTLRSWSGLKDLAASGYRGGLTIRCNEAQSKWFVPWTSTGHLPGRWGITQVEFDLAKLTAKSRLPESFFYLQEVPSQDTIRVANIEAMPRSEYLHLETNTREPVRGIRERTKPLYSTTARIVLRSAISEESYDTLEAIWDNYPTAIIEATEFPRVVGTLSKRLVIWEVRCY
jgi:hypothetical protein